MKRVGLNKSLKSLISHVPGDTLVFDSKTVLYLSHLFLSDVFLISSTNLDLIITVHTLPLAKYMSPNACICQHELHLAYNMQVNVCIYKFFLSPFIAFLFTFKLGFKKGFTYFLFFNKSRFISFFHLHSSTVCHLKVETFLILQLFWSVCCCIVHTWLSGWTGRVGSGRKAKGDVGNYRGNYVFLVKRLIRITSRDGCHTAYFFNL